MCEHGDTASRVAMRKIALEKGKYGKNTGINQHSPLRQHGMRDPLLSLINFIKY